MSIPVAEPEVEVTGPEQMTELEAPRFENGQGNKACLEVVTEIAGEESGVGLG